MQGRDLDVARWLYAFQSWARPRIVRAAQSLQAEQLQQHRVIAGGTADGSLFQTIAHLVGAQTLWLARWRGQSHAQLPTAAEYPDLATLTTAWGAADEEMARFVEELSVDDLSQSVSYLSVTRQVIETFPLWQTLLHVANHTTHHRAEACVALTALGSPPESVDLVDFMRSV